MQEEKVLEEQEITKEENPTKENSTKENSEAKVTESKKEKAKLKYKDVIVKLQNDNAKLKDDYLRAHAEMENSKKRIKEEAIKERKYASQKLVSELLTPLDMLVKVVNMESKNPEILNFLIGFKMITNQIFEVLEKDGLKEIEALEKDFDPNVHHAVTKETKDGIEPNKVIEVLQTGYMYKDRLIKPAMVKVSE